MGEGEVAVQSEEAKPKQEVPTATAPTGTPKRRCWRVQGKKKPTEAGAETATSIHPYTPQSQSESPSQSTSSRNPSHSHKAASRATWETPTHKGPTTSGPTRNPSPTLHQRPRLPGSFCPGGPADPGVHHLCGGTQYHRGSHADWRAGHHSRPQQRRLLVREGPLRHHLPAR